MAPNKKNDGTLDDLLHWIESGNNVSDSCTLAGIHRDTYYEWKKDPDIADKIDAAEKRCKARAIGIWQEAMPKDWKASRDWLERKYKKEFSRMEIQEVKNIDELLDDVEEKKEYAPWESPTNS